MKQLLVGLFIASLVLAAPADANVLRNGRLPMCGPDDPAFRQLRAGLNQWLAWQGDRMDRNGLHSGVLELAIGRTGKWSLYFRFVGTDGRPRICLVSRGVSSQAIFGRPM
ncbi:MAG: hypothetical protein NXI27_26000 [Alphaproteobacteria bacterium]|nr:hypothetical protein [Alphaproteobacteria bacterium]